MNDEGKIESIVHEEQLAELLPYDGEFTGLVVLDDIARTGDAASLRELLAVVTVERDDALAKAEHNFAAYRDVLSVVQQTRAAFDALSAKYLAVEARVRADVADEIAVKIERSAKDQMAEPVTEEDPNIALGMGFAAHIARLAAGSSPDTTPEEVR